LLIGGQSTSELAQSLKTLAAEHGFPFWEAQAPSCSAARCASMARQKQDSPPCARVERSSRHRRRVVTPILLAHLAEAYAQAEILLQD
jgi:hypothetical protein